MKTFMISGCTPKYPGRQCGLVVVELAITLPLVILIMFAVSELGRAFYQYTTLTKAVEAGTRYYASNPTIEKARIENLVICASPKVAGCNTADEVLPGITVNVEYPPLDDHVRVSAGYVFVPIIGNLPIFGELTNITMTATQTMRAL